MPTAIEKEAAQFVSEPEVREVLTLKKELYGGSTEAMQRDLRERLERRPYIHKLHTRIRTDLGRLDKIGGYERAGVDLYSLLQNVSGKK